jgi:hypothetical protein
MALDLLPGRDSEECLYRVPYMESRPEDSRSRGSDHPDPKRTCHCQPATKWLLMNQPGSSDCSPTAKWCRSITPFERRVGSRGPTSLRPAARLGKAVP